MSTADDDTQVLHALGNGNGNGAAPSNLLASLRARRVEHAAPQTFDIDVPGFNGCLVLRCGPVDSTLLARSAERIDKSKSPLRYYNLQADLLVAACIEVLGRTDSEDELLPLDADEPVCIDDRLAEGLGIEAVSARELVRQLFGAAPMPELAVGAAMTEYMDWAAAVNADTDEAWLGESPAAPR